jgi:hypothetical protein
MQDWQFLLQKENDSFNNDRADSGFWKASGDSTIALVEGRYKIMAQSNQIDVDVAIKITHQIISAGKTLRRSQQRSRRINSEGEVIILPFLEFQAGWWEIECSGELVTEFGSQIWQKKLEIQIYSKQSFTEQNAEAIEPFVEKPTVSVEEKKLQKLIERFDSVSQSDRGKSQSDRDKQALISQPIALSCDLNLDGTVPSTEAIELFEPKKANLESIQTLPLSGQILPPKMLEDDRDRDNSHPVSNKRIQLPKINLTNFEFDRTTQIPPSDRENSEPTKPVTPSKSDRFEALNLQQKFLLRLESLMNDSRSERTD